MIGTQQDIVIIGAGCVGQGLAASLLLSHPANRVFLIPSHRSFPTLKENGISLTGAVQQSFKPSERFIIRHQLKSFALKEFNVARQPWVFLATKTADAITSLKAITDLLFHRDPVLICLQNGLGIEKTAQLAVQLFDITVLKGHVFSALFRQENKIFTHTGRIIVEAHETANGALTNLFGSTTNSLFKLEISANILAAIYPKLVINCICNPLTVIFNQNLGQLRHQQEKLILKICQEFYQLSLRLQLHFTSCHELASIVLTAMEHFSNHYSSMYLDIANAKKTEIHEINGGVLKLAQTKNHPMPLNAFLKKSIKEIEHLRSTCHSSAAFYNEHADFLTGTQRALLSLAAT